MGSSQAIGALVGQFYRKSKGYDGTGLTSRRVSDLLPQMLSSLIETRNDRPDLVLAVWPEIIGEKLASMTQAVSFNDGFLVVKVRNSTLYSLLSQHEKPKILARLKAKFPKVRFKTIIFRVG